ncbi:Hypothetical predicted protein, partial [Scomber scombrus]
DDEQIREQISGGEFGGSMFLQVQRPELMGLNFHLEASSAKYDPVYKNKQHMKHFEASC